MLDAGSKNRTLDSPICTKLAAPGYSNYAGIGFVPFANNDEHFVLIVSKWEFIYCRNRNNISKLCNYEEKNLRKII